MKRLGAILLALALVCGTLMGYAPSAYAEEGTAAEVIVR